MAGKNRLYDPTAHHFILDCPACGQKYALLGLMVQDDEEMACTSCNALFKLKIDGSTVSTVLLTPSTGAPLGPAEGPDRR